MMYSLRILPTISYASSSLMPRVRLTKLDSNPSGQRKHIVQGWSIEGVLYQPFALGEEPEMISFVCNGKAREPIGKFNTSALTHVALDENLNGIIETRTGSTYKVERLADDLFRDRY